MGHDSPYPNIITSIKNKSGVYGSIGMKFLMALIMIYGLRRSFQVGISYCYDACQSNYSRCYGPQTSLFGLASSCHDLYDGCIRSCQGDWFLKVFGVK